MARLCAMDDCGRDRGERRRRDAVSGLRLCRPCYARVRTGLAELPVLYAECESVLARFTIPFNQRVRGGERRGLCLNEAAVNARLAIESVLGAWSARTAGELRVARPSGRDVGTLASYLLGHLDRLLAFPAAPAFAAVVVTTVATARGACRPAPGPRLELGRCVHEGCAGMLLADASDVDGRPAQIRCDAGHVWRPNEWLLLAHRLGQRGDGVRPVATGRAST